MSQQKSKRAKSVKPSKIKYLTCLPCSTHGRCVQYLNSAKTFRHQPLGQPKPSEALSLTFALIPAWSLHSDLIILASLRCDR